MEIFSTLHLVSFTVLRLTLTFFAAFPALEYDSWMTIGMMSALDAGVLGNIGLDAAMTDFTNTGSFYVDDPIGGSWYNTIPCDPACNSRLY